MGNMTFFFSRPVAGVSMNFSKKQYSPARYNSKALQFTVCASLHPACCPKQHTLKMKTLLLGATYSHASIGAHLRVCAGRNPLPTIDRSPLPRLLLGPCPPLPRENVRRMDTKPHRRLHPPPLNNRRRRAGRGGDGSAAALSRLQLQLHSRRHSHGGFRLRH